MTTETEAKQEPSTTTQRSVNTWIIATSVGLLLAAGSIALYMNLGHPTALEVPKSDYGEIPGVGVHQDAGDIRDLLQGLKEKLERDPDNGSGWALLARSYVELRQHREALPAFSEALKRMPEDEQLLVDYADALGVAHDGVLNGKAVSLIEEAMQLNPQNTKALLLSATVAYEQKEYSKAVTYWETVLGQEDVDLGVIQEVKANIAEVKGLSPGGVIPITFMSPRQAFADEPRIIGQVRIAPELSDEISPNDTVYIFAKSSKDAKPPVAVLRVDQQEWPYSFELNDSHQVMEGRKLSDFGEVIIVARVSKSGDALPQSGDLEGISQPVQVGSESVEVMINTQIP